MPKRQRNGQEKYLHNKTLYKIVFPEFWITAYRDKNSFFQRIERYAHKFVEETNRGHEYLEGDKIQYFWHAHCAFCWEKAETDKVCTFYCTEDMQHWICAECFDDFCSEFNWQEGTAEEVLSASE